MARKKAVVAKPVENVDTASSEELEGHILSLQSNTQEVKTPEVEVPSIIGTQPTAEELGKDEQKEEVQEAVERDESSQEQASEEKEVKEEEVVAPPPELIMGKFKSMDELAKAYKEAEKKISQQGERGSQYKQLLGQMYDLDEEGNVIGLKAQFQQPAPQQQPYQPDPLSQLRQYYPEMSDEQIRAHMFVQSNMIQAALAEQKKEFMKEFEPFRALRYEKDFETQRKLAREKYESKIPDYDVYEGITLERVSKLPPELRAKENAFDMMLLATVGEHTPEMLEKAQEKAKLKAQKQRKQVEAKKDDSFVEGAGKASIPTPPPDVASMSSEDYLKWLQKQPNYGQK